MAGYSEGVLQRFCSTQRYGQLDHPQARSAESGDRAAGLWVRFSVLSAAEGQRKARFYAYGDVACIACCDLLVEQFEQAGRAGLSGSCSALLGELNLPEGKYRSAEVALQALSLALQAAEASSRC